MFFKKYLNYLMKFLIDLFLNRNDKSTNQFNEKTNNHDYRLILFTII